MRACVPFSKSISYDSLYLYICARAKHGHPLGDTHIYINIMNHKCIFMIVSSGYIDTDTDTDTDTYM